MGGKGGKGWYCLHVFDVFVHFPLVSKSPFSVFFSEQPGEFFEAFVPTPIAMLARELVLGTG